MEEIEKNRMIKNKKISETNVVQKIMTVFVATTIREIVKSVNEEGIKKEDIVSLFKDNGQFILIYYK